MASAVKITSAFGASAFLLSVLMTGANAQDAPAAQTCETASLNSTTSFTPSTFTQEDFFAINKVLNDLGLLEPEIIHHLKEGLLATDAQQKKLERFSDELDNLLNGEYADVGEDFNAFHPTVLANIAEALEGYISVLESLYSDNPEVIEALASIAPNREALKNTQTQVTQQMELRMGIISCIQPAVPQNEQTPSLALS